MNSTTVLALLMHTQSNAILPVHNAKHLFANILRSLQCSDLHKVLVAPRTGKLVVTPRVVDGEQRQVVSFRLVEFGLLLIGECLLVLYDTDSKCCHHLISTISIQHSISSRFDSSMCKTVFRNRSLS